MNKQANLSAFADFLFVFLRPIAIQKPLIQSMPFEIHQAALVREICRLVTNAPTSIETEMFSASPHVVTEKQSGPRHQGYRIQGVYQLYSWALCWLARSLLRLYKDYKSWIFLG